MLVTAAAMQEHVDKYLSELLGLDWSRNEADGRGVNDPAQTLLEALCIAYAIDKLSLLSK